MLPHLVLISVLFSAEAATLGSRKEPPSFPGLPTINELAAASGYEATNVEVMTADGYSLWIHRIGNNEGTPVLVQHGIFMASESWITRGLDKDLVFLLLKEGFDVWLANQRGTAYNEYCLTQNRSDPRFWDFSFHESGYYDIPAFIDTILNIRGADQLYYLGHSLGTTVFLVMASTRPEYNSKIRAAGLLAPVAFPPTFEEQTPILRMLIKNSNLIYKVLLGLGQYAIARRSMASIKILRDFCGQNSISQNFCLDICGLFAGEHRSNLNMKEYGNYMAYFGAGSSTKTLYHLAQVYLTGEFKQFDYENKQQNILRYNSTRPPNYNLDSVTAPVALFWGNNDPLISKTSVGKLASALPNLVFSRMVPDPLFTHVDMYLGMNADRVLFPDIINYFKYFEMG